MDQIKVGKFIAECRKKNNLTQMQLAEKLGITDRAVSKRENGKAMPDSAIMLELCDALDITVNDLLNGENVTAEEYNHKLEQQLLEMVQQKQNTDKSLMTTQILLMVLSTVMYFTALTVAMVAVADLGWYLLLSIITIVVYVAIDVIAFRLGYKAGYYRCKKCGHTYIPPFKTAFFGAVTLGGRISYFRCEHCKKRAWHKKVITKE